MEYVYCLLIGYFIGSLPFAVIVAKACGVDIFSVGSGNPGATNVLRSIGRKAGYIVFSLDFIKGFAAAYLPAWAWFEYSSGPEVVAVVCLIGAVLGHSLSCFIGFRGGKGVATMLGGLSAVLLVPTIVGILVWLAVFYGTRYVSLASILLAIALAVAAYVVEGFVFVSHFAAIISLFVVYRHIPNIKRLLQGKESRFG